jgi:Holliday junction resolvasome RuvABC endonuclease subunit
MIMIILSLDMAINTGWACNDPEISGVECFRKKTGESTGMIYVRFCAWLDEMIHKLHPTIIIYEQAHHRGRAATEIALGLLGHMKKICCVCGVEYSDCHSATLKKFATGNGKSQKKAMMVAYEHRWGVPPQDDNECDARWLLEWAKSQYWHDLYSLRRTSAS